MNAHLAGLLTALFASICAGVFATLQMSLRVSSRGRLKELATRCGRSPRLTPILEDMSAHALAASLPRVLCNLIVVVGALIWATGVGEDSRVSWGSLLLAGGVSLALLSINGVVIPMSLADHAGDAVVMRFAWLIRLIRVCTLPIVRALGVVDEIVKRLAGVRDGTREEELERELLSVMSEAEHEGNFNQSERHMIEAIMDFSSRTVEEVMTPRTEIDGLEATDNLSDIKAFILRAGHSRIPVYEDDLDHIIGVLYAKDLLGYLAEDAAEFSLRKAIREARFVPETKSIAEMLLEFQRDKVHLAIVIDEYGGTAGLVTIEDVLEEIVGEIQDEYEPIDEAPPEIALTAESRSLEVDARASILDVNDRLDTLGVALPESDDYDTVGGFVLTELGRLPEEGEVFTKSGFTVTVLASEPTRVTRVRIDFSAPSAERAAEDVSAAGGK